MRENPTKICIYLIGEQEPVMYPWPSYVTPRDMRDRVASGDGLLEFEAIDGGLELIPCRAVTRVTYIY